MASIKRFEDFECWQLARQLDKDIFDSTKNNLFAKDYSLKDQILRASGSIMDNIAEGFERGGNKEFFQFLSISKASCAEVKSQLHRACDREYINKETFEKLYDESSIVAKKISGLMNYISSSDLKGSKYKNQH